MKLRYGARIDCYRGEGFHDFKNIVWTNIKDKLPEFTKYLKNHQNPDSEIGLGNAMEQAAGVSYAAATYGQLLPEDGQLLWYNLRQHKAWIRVWFAYQELGLKPQLGEPPDLYDDDEEDEDQQESDDDGDRPVRQQRRHDIPRAQEYDDDDQQGRQLRELNGRRVRDAG